MTARLALAASLLVTACTSTDLAGFECTGDDQCAQGFVCCPRAGANSTCEEACDVQIGGQGESCSKDVATHELAGGTWAEPCEDPVPFHAAAAICSALEGQGWGLPQLSELSTLAACTGFEPAVCRTDDCRLECGECAACGTPGELGPAPSQCATYWSAQQGRQRDGTTCYEGFDYATGRLVEAGAAAQHRVLCVR